MTRSESLPSVSGKRSLIVQGKKKRGSLIEIVFGT